MAVGASDNNIVHDHVVNGVTMTSIPNVPWQLESLRLTAFDVFLDAEAVEAICIKLVGQPPENLTVDRRVEQIIARSPYQKALLVLTHQFGCFTLQVVQDPNDELFPILGIWSDFDRFTSIFKKWVATTSCSRLAFGANFLHPFPNEHLAAEFCQSYLPTVKVPSPATDFIYQANRPIDSETVPNISTNRLANWSIIRLQLTRALPSPHAEATKVDKGFFCRLTLDVNTSHQTKIPKEANLSSLYGELSSYVCETAIRGDSA